MFGSEILIVTPNVNANGSLLTVEYTRLKKMKIKPVVFKRIIKSRLKEKPLTEVRLTRSKNKYKSKLKFFSKNVNKIEVLTGQDLIAPKQKPHMSLQQKMKKGNGNYQTK